MVIFQVGAGLWLDFLVLQPKRAGSSYFSSEDSLRKSSTVKLSSSLVKLSSSRPSSLFLFFLYFLSLFLERLCCLSWPPFFFFIFSNILALSFCFFFLGQFSGLQYRCSHLKHNLLMYFPQQGHQRVQRLYYSALASFLSKYFNLLHQTVYFLILLLRSRMRFLTSSSSLSFRGNLGGRPALDSSSSSFCQSSPSFIGQTSYLQNYLLRGSKQFGRGCSEYSLILLTFNVLPEEVRSDSFSSGMLKTDKFMKLVTSESEVSYLPRLLFLLDFFLRVFSSIS